MNLADHFEALEWTETTVEVHVKGVGPAIWPRTIGQSSDGKTALELIGGPDNIRSITLLGEMSAADLEATRRNGAYAAVCLAIVAPNWSGRDTWLAHTMRRLRQLRHTTIQQSGWRIRVAFERGVFTLRAVKV